MKKTERNLTLLNCVFVTSLVVSNIVAGKVIDIFGLIVPAAVVAYPLTFLCTDIIGEIWGKEEANRTVKRGILMQLFSLLLITIAIYLPSASFAQEYGNNLKVVLGQNVRFVLASLTAYILAQSNDVFIFHKLKDKFRGKHKWLRNNVSTMLSQLIDTAIFITIGFWGTVPSILTMIMSQYVVKFFLALADTPFFYLLTRENKEIKVDKQAS
ncbi:queuosine precursor transporter [Clostridioides difficile]|uniref:queuosine precursor transporter n=1 Tax=Clostridioides difficile TaxID=1496 RepID=UPI000A974E04|nr:queuosine precursor transporter [Clostridioides difficile]HBF4641959.1 queuosine precursor transporter [Clostridioides difficile]HBF5173690.1 queuosine precursor transporter [Clostridioides difficile]HBN6207500.1 queuosine precursor transporter [Clostridioides difficile]